MPTSIQKPSQKLKEKNMDQQNDKIGNVETIASLGSKSTSVEVITIENIAGLHGAPDKIPAVVIKGNFPQIISAKHLFDDYRSAPEKKDGTAKTESLESFIDLLNRHKTPDSAVFAQTDWKNPSLTGVIDYHPIKSDTKPADNLRHKITYNFPLSEEWKEWGKMNDEKMSQGQFAAFIEDRIADLGSPEESDHEFVKETFFTTIATPAKIMELSRGLQVNVDSDVKNIVTLQSGEGQVNFTESHKGSDGKPLQVPGMFLLRISPFISGEFTRIYIRLRYRASNGSVIWFYQIYRPDQVISQVVQTSLKKVYEKTGLPVFEGQPENSSSM